jgi:hypothetical protein
LALRDEERAAAEGRKRYIDYRGAIRQEPMAEGWWLMAIVKFGFDV